MKPLLVLLIAAERTLAEIKREERSTPTEKRGDALAAAIIPSLMIAGLIGAFAYVVHEKTADPIADRQGWIISVSAEGFFEVGCGACGPHRGYLAGIGRLTDAEGMLLKAFLKERVEMDYVQASPRPNGCLEIVYYDRISQGFPLLGEEFFKTLRATR